MPSLQMVRNVLGLNALAPSDRGTGKGSSGVDLVLYVFLVALIALAAWAVAAGANRAWDSFASGKFAEQWNGWLSAPAVAALAILYTIGALGTAALIMLAAALLGGLFGF